MPPYMVVDAETRNADDLDKPIALKCFKLPGMLLRLRARASRYRTMSVQCRAFAASELSEKRLKGYHLRSNLANSVIFNTRQQRISNDSSSISVIPVVEIVRAVIRAILEDT